MRAFVPFPEKLLIPESESPTPDGYNLSYRQATTNMRQHWNLNFADGTSHCERIGGSPWKIQNVSNYWSWFEGDFTFSQEENRKSHLIIFK